jgi:hypothetical protein
MDKQAFITKLMTMYPSQFAGSTCDDWVREYEIALNADYEINFDKLWETIRNEYKYSTTPHTSWLVEQLPKCKATSNPIFGCYVDVEITPFELYGKGNDIPYVFSISERELLTLKHKGKKYKIVSEPYKIGG